VDWPHFFRTPRGYQSLHSPCAYDLDPVEHVLGNLQGTELADICPETIRDPVGIVDQRLHRIGKETWLAIPFRRDSAYELSLERGNARRSLAQVRGGGCLAAGPGAHWASHLHKFAELTTISPHCGEFHLRPGQQLQTREMLIGSKSLAIVLPCLYANAYTQASSFGEDANRGIVKRTVDHGNRRSNRSYQP
jgi:hypothetical protein